VLPAEVLETIEAIVRLPSTEQRVAKKGQAVSLMAAAVGTSDIPMLVGVNERTVRKGKKRFDCESPMDKLQPHRQKMWLPSHDDELRAQRDDVLHVYDDTPPDEHIICLDEVRGLQILERLCPDIPMAPAMPVRRAFEYKRHGTLTLMGALDVRRGKVCATWTWAGPTGEHEARSRRIL